MWSKFMILAFFVDTVGGQVLSDVPGQNLFFIIMYFIVLTLLLVVLFLGAFIYLKCIDIEYSLRSLHESVKQLKTFSQNLLPEAPRLQETKETKETIRHTTITFKGENNDYTPYIPREDNQMKRSKSLNSLSTEEEATEGVLKACNSILTFDDFKNGIVLPGVHYLKRDQEMGDH